MKKVSVIAINEDCYEREKRLKEFLRRNLKKYGIEVVEFEASSINAMVKQAINETDKVIIAFDAVRSINSNFSLAALEFCKQNYKPILFVTSFDEEDVDIKHAKNALGELWTLEKPYLESWDLFFKTRYFSYKTMSITKNPVVQKQKENGINYLVELLK